MMKAKVEIIGDKELMAAFKKLADEDMLEALQKASSAGAELVKAAAKAKAPRDTGALAEGIGISKDLKGKKGVLAEVSTSEETYYGLFQEYGTSKMPKHPFLRPALDENQNKVNQLFTDAIQEAVDKIDTGVEMP